MHERGKISKNDENPSKNDKKLQNGPKKLSRYAQSCWIRVYKEQYGCDFFAQHNILY